MRRAGTLVLCARAEVLRPVRSLLPKDAAEGLFRTPSRTSLLQADLLRAQAEVLRSGTEVLRPGAQVLRSRAQVLRPVRSLLPEDAAEGPDGPSSCPSLLQAEVLQAQVLRPGADVLRLVERWMD